MTFTTVLNAVMLAVGPVVATFLALDITSKEGAQTTAIKAALVNLGCIVLKLTMIAIVAPILTYSTGMDA